MSKTAAKDGNLTKAERSLVAAASRGKEYRCCDGNRPNRQNKKKSRTIRAEVIRRLCTGEDRWPVHDKGVILRGAWISGHLDLEWAEVSRPLILLNCYLEEKPVFSRATMKGLCLSGCQTPGLEAEQLECRGNVAFDEDFVATKQVSLAGATIRGQVSLSGTFKGEDGPAIIAPGLECKAGVFLTGPFVAEGEVNLSRSKVGVAIVFTGATLRNPAHQAFSAEGLECNGSVHLSGGFSAEGGVSLAFATLAGSLICSKGEFMNTAGYALNLEGLVCRGEVYLNDGFSAIGEVTLAGASISGQVDCGAGTLTNPDRCALNAQGIECRGDMFLRGNFYAKGEVNLAGANVTGQVSCEGGTIDGSLVMSGVRVGGQFFWSEIKEAQLADLDLDGAHVTTLVIDRASPPRKLVLTRFTYEAFHPIDDHKVQQSWLARAEYNPQPYQELARVLRQHGYREGATLMLIAGEQRRLADPSTRFRDRIWGRILAATVGHGYRPGRAVIWLLVLWLFGWGCFGVGGHCRTMLPAPDSRATAAEFGWLDALFYSLDTMLPVIDLGVADAWHPSRGHLGLWVYWRLHVTLGWVFTTLAVLGFTGLVRKKD
jgi:hypothetical protein